MKITDTDALLDQAAHNWARSLSTDDLTRLLEERAAGESGHLVDGFLAMAEKAAFRHLVARFA